jgi:hypothetical protein
VTTARGGLLTSGQVTTTANWSLLPAAIWSQGGMGDNVFDMPTYIRRVRVIADYGDYSQNFIVRIGGSLVVNELMGRGWNQTHFEGTYQTTGGTVAITGSSGVRWSFQEVR